MMGDSLRYVLNRTNPKSVSVFGVRGAFPAMDDAFREFGGNTSCMALDYGEDLIVLDAGSGIIQLGAALANSSKFKRIHILLSHLHLDHIQGLMGFNPLFDADANVHIYGEGKGALAFHDRLDRVLGPPYWPISLKDVPSQPELHEIEPDMSFMISGDITVQTLRSCHPNDSLMFRIEDASSSVVYTLDCELTEDLFPRLVHFSRNCSLLIWDANYADDCSKSGWGHSTWKQGISVARASGAKKILMTHFDRSYTDNLLREQERAAIQADENCLFAREGMVIAL